MVQPIRKECDNMITCMGLIVGLVESPTRQDLCKKCLKWVKQYPHLINLAPLFEIEKIEYMQLIDTYVENGITYGYFKFVDGEVVIVAE